MSNNASTLSSLPKEIVYPESDGLPMADNTIQYRWIVTIEGGLEAQYAAEPNVFVAGNLFWYPVEGHPEIFQTPDILVVFGRLKGDRGASCVASNPSMVASTSILVLPLLFPFARRHDLHHRPPRGWSLLEWRVREP